MVVAIQILMRGLSNMSKTSDLAIIKMQQQQNDINQQKHNIFETITELTQDIENLKYQRNQQLKKLRELDS